MPLCRNLKSYLNIKPSGNPAKAALCGDVIRMDRAGKARPVQGFDCAKTPPGAKVIEQVQRPTLVLAHNKTLAAQLCAEFKEFFPNNAVEYFVSYYDYYQPEAYIPIRTPLSKRIPPSTRRSTGCGSVPPPPLLERRDVIVVSSVSCIYGLGEPEDFAKPDGGPPGGGRDGTGMSCCAAWWRSATSATTSPLSGTCSGSGGTRWRSSPPTTGTTPSGWSSSGTRSIYKRNELKA